MILLSAWMSERNLEHQWWRHSASVLFLSLPIVCRSGPIRGLKRRVHLKITSPLNCSALYTPKRFNWELRSFWDNDVRPLSNITEHDGTSAYDHSKNLTLTIIHRPCRDSWAVSCWNYFFLLNSNRPSSHWRRPALVTLRHVNINGVLLNGAVPLHQLASCPLPHMSWFRFLVFWFGVFMLKVYPRVSCFTSCLRLFSQPFFPRFPHSLFKFEKKL